MFDLGRALALAWTAYAIARSRRWAEACVLILAAYLFGLEVAAGITIRAEGPQEPILAVLLVVLGPSGMPPGRLPALPFVALVRSPASVHGVATALLALPFATLWRRAHKLRPESLEAARLDRAALAFLLSATLEALEAAALAVPRLLGSGL